MIATMNDRQAAIYAALGEFNGTEHWWSHPMFKCFTYTDGVRYIAQECGAYWLLEAVFASQLGRRVRQEEFQVWSLRVQDRSAFLTCDNGNGCVVYRQEIEFTDFPLDEITLYFENSVLCLPSER